MTQYYSSAGYGILITKEMVFACIKNTIENGCSKEDFLFTFGFDLETILESYNLKNEDISLEKCNDLINKLLFELPDGGEVIKANYLENQLDFFKYNIEENFFDEVSPKYEDYFIYRLDYKFSLFEPAYNNEEELFKELLSVFPSLPRWYLEEKLLENIIHFQATFY